MTVADDLTVLEGDDAIARLKTRPDVEQFIAEARAEERESILNPPGYDDRHHADGSIGPDEAPPYGGDAAYWYRRWLFLARQLDEEATERLNAYANFNEKLADAVRLAERARIREAFPRHKVEWLIHTLDLIDKLAKSRGMDTSTEAQDDLRKLADLLDGTA